LLRYKGIRPAQVIRLVRPFRKPDLEITKCRKEIGVTLTESMAMWPASSVSGYYFEIKSKYFGLGKIKEDQVIDYAQEVSLQIQQRNG
jgi:5-methyltetrahydrofolate--homocysteine methyltransferase